MFSPTDSGQYRKAVLDITDDCLTKLNDDQANPDGDAMIDAFDDDLFSICSSDRYLYLSTSV